MSRLMRHRGPDDEGVVLLDVSDGGALVLGGPDTPDDVYASGLPYAPGRRTGDRTDARYAVGLLHRRLSIVDLSPAGHQPMCDRDRRSWLVFNGEVYNWVELRRELESLGDTFVSASDTEVILAAYHRWGPECLSRFNGMFALALWDTRERRLFCARDRFGVKPFYYQHEDGRFAFASEPKALVLTQPRPIAGRDEAVRDLLALDWVDHRDTTFFDGLMQLPAAHWLSVGENGLEIRRWWGLDPARRAPGGPAAWTGEFAELFTDAVRLRLRADVPVGSCLSGGLDSSAVVTTMARLGAGEQHTFSCAYDVPGFDERPHIDAAVAASGARPHLVVPDGADFWSVFDRLAYQQDEPTAGSGLYSQWKVMELAHRAGLKVLLDGQGGDETLAGYFRYLPIALRDRLARGDVAGFARGFGDVAGRLGARHHDRAHPRAVAAGAIVRAAAPPLRAGQGPRAGARAAGARVPSAAAAARVRQRPVAPARVRYAPAAAALAAALRGPQQHGVLGRDAAAVPRLPAGGVRVRPARRPAPRRHDHQGHPAPRARRPRARERARAP